MTYCLAREERAEGIDFTASGALTLSTDIAKENKITGEEKSNASWRGWLHTKESACCFLGPDTHSGNARSDPQTTDMYTGCDCVRVRVGWKGQTTRACRYLGRCTEGKDSANWLLAPTERGFETQTGRPVSCATVGKLEKERMAQIEEGH